MWGRNARRPLCSLNHSGGVLSLKRPALHSPKRAVFEADSQVSGPLQGGCAADARSVPIEDSKHGSFAERRAGRLRLKTPPLVLSGQSGLRAARPRMRGRNARKPLCPLNNSGGASSLKRPALRSASELCLKLIAAQSQQFPAPCGAGAQRTRAACRSKCLRASKWLVGLDPRNRRSPVDQKIMY